jgi:hypothetical protein
VLYGYLSESEKQPLLGFVKVISESGNHHRFRFLGERIQIKEPEVYRKEPAVLGPVIFPVVEEFENRGCVSQTGL